MFLIEEAWSDNLENHPAQAFGYKPLAYVENEEEAKTLTEIKLPKSFSWVLNDDETPQFRYRKLERMKVREHKF